MVIAIDVACLRITLGNDLRSGLEGGVRVEVFHHRIPFLHVYFSSLNKTSYAKVRGINVETLENVTLPTSTFTNTSSSRGLFESGKAMQVHSYIKVRLKATEACELFIAFQVRLADVRIDLLNAAGEIAGPLFDVSHVR